MTATRLSTNHHYFQHSLGAWVQQLIETFPWFDLDDIAQTIERKTSLAITDEDLQVIEAQYMEQKLRAWAIIPSDGE